MGSSILLNVFGHLHDLLCPISTFPSASLVCPSFTILFSWLALLDLRITYKSPPFFLPDPRSLNFTFPNFIYCIIITYLKSSLCLFLTPSPERIIPLAPHISGPSSSFGPGFWILYSLHYLCCRNSRILSLTIRLDSFPLPAVILSKYLSMKETKKSLLFMAVLL